LIARAAGIYLAIFVCVLVALSVGAYAFVAREYASLLAPALGTPEGAAAMATAMRRVLLTIVTIDVPLVAVVGVASYALARATIAPLQAARERERTFAADAAHALRSPLAAIAAVAQVARAGAPPESQGAFDAIVQSTFEASDAITDLLTLARDPARRVLQCEPVDLAAVVTSSARRAQPVATERGIRLDVAAASAIVDGDERRLAELARNLLDNAIRHARTNVRIASRGNGRCGEIVVEDDGEGIPAPERERIFERFYRREQNGGSGGLGLAIVRWIADAHGGEVRAGEAPGGGAQFVATVPVRH
jgi:signal transduction histidine kinase